MYKRKEDGVIFPWLQKHLHPQETVVDIGARKAGWYKHVAQFFPHAPAKLFEPTPNIVDFLKRKYRSNKNVEIFPIALSNTTGEIDFHIDLKRGGWSGLQRQFDHDHYDTITVEVRTLDSFNFQDVQLIKIDVEGNELNTLEGSKETIIDSRPLVYFECADVHLKSYDYNASDLFNFFTKLDYSVLDLDFKKLSVEDFCAHSASDPSFYHNFLARYDY